MFRKRFLISDKVNMRAAVLDPCLDYLIKIARSLGLWDGVSQTSGAFD